MNIKTKLSITLILLIIFGVCCSQSSQSVAIVTESDSLLEYEVKELPIETASVGLDEDNTNTEDVIRPENWSEESHSNDVDPNYDVVFPEDQVNQIVITIGPEDWALMQANMTELFGTAGSGKSGGFGGQGGKNPQTGEQPDNLQPPTNDQAPPEIPEDKMGNGPGKGVQTAC